MDVLTCNNCSASITDGTTNQIDGDDFCFICYSDFESCGDCNEKIVDGDEEQTADGDVVCAGCYGDNYSSCDRCGCGGLKSGDMAEVSGDFWCDDCSSRYASDCYNCGDMTDCDDMTHDGNSNGFCNNCSDDLHYCNGCGEYWEEYCDCGDSGSGDLIDYIDGNHNPLRNGLHTMANDSAPLLHLGAEIELSYTGDDVSGDAASIHNLFGDTHFAYAGDCSIERGVEVISAPMTLDFWTAEKTVTMERLYQNWNLWDLSQTNAGLHVHVSRAGLLTKAYDVIGLLMYGDAEFQHFAKWLSRRNGDFHFCPFNVADSLSDSDGKRLDKKASAKMFMAPDSANHYKPKYAAVNVNHRDTLEFRLFKAPRTYAQFREALEMVECIAQFGNSIADVHAADLHTFMAYAADNAKRYSHLVAALERYIDSEYSTAIREEAAAAAYSERRTLVLNNRRRATAARIARREERVRELQRQTVRDYDARLDAASVNALAPIWENMAGAGREDAVEHILRYAAIAAENAAMRVMEQQTLADAIESQWQALDAGRAGLDTYQFRDVNYDVRYLIDRLRAGNYDGDGRTRFAELQGRVQRHVNARLGVGYYDSIFTPARY
jgi:hypothetical protein